MANINLKDIRMGIKRGLTAADLIKKYGLQSEEELFEKIRKMASRGSKDIIADLKKNEKKHGLKGAKKDTGEETEKAQYVTESASEAESEAESEALEVNPKASLETLLAEEKNLSQEICNLEGSHKEMMQRRRNIVSNLQKIKSESEEILEALQKLRAESAQLKSEYDKIAEDMRSTSDEIGVMKEVLAELRAQIEEAKKITILVYSDGNIDIEAEGMEVPTFVSPSEEEQSSIFTSFLTRPDVEEFTIKELRAMTRLIPMLKQIEGIKYEIVFDNPRLEDFYMGLTATAEA